MNRDRTAFALGYFRGVTVDKNPEGLSLEGAWKAEGGQIPPNPFTQEDVKGLRAQAAHYIEEGAKFPASELAGAWFNELADRIEALPTQETQP